MAQITPPGMGKGETAAWFAFGVNRHLDSVNRKSAESYVAIGRRSNPGEYNPVDKQITFVLNHEITVKFAEHQQYSYALSYRRNNVFEPEAPYHKTGIEQEIRAYGKYAYSVEVTPRLSWKNTIRQEFRKFFDADFKNVPENFQLRTRLKTQLDYQLSENHSQKLQLGVEGLFAISYRNAPSRDWTPFAYEDLRLTFFYSIAIPNSALTLDVGYMDDIIEGYHGVHYAAVDVVWDIPFHNN